MNTEIKLITPTYAKELLKKNNSNRKVNNSTVQNYSNQMKSGQWKLTHQGVAISADGEILDGQHRLKAIVSSNTTVEMMITYNSPQESFKVLDTGKNRSGSDCLSMMKIDNATTISAGIRTYLILSGGSEHIKSCQGKAKITNTDVVDSYRLHSETYDKIASLSILYHKKNKLIPKGDIMGMYLLMAAKHGETRADNFLSQACGVNETSSVAISMLRDRLINDLSSKGKLTRQHKFILYSKAWNAFISDTDVKSLQIRKNDTEIKFN